MRSTKKWQTVQPSSESKITFPTSVLLTHRLLKRKPNLVLDSEISVQESVITPTTVHDQLPNKSYMWP